MPINHRMILIIMRVALSHGFPQGEKCFAVLFPLSPKLSSVVLEYVLHRNNFILRKPCEERKDSSDSWGHLATQSTPLMLPLTKAMTMFEVER